jgi:FdhD protein
MTETIRLVEESAWRLELNGESFAAGTCTPELVDCLAAGRLLAEGVVGRGTDIDAIEIEPEGGVIVARVAVDSGLVAMALDERSHRRTAGCGLLHFLECQPHALQRAERAEPPAADRFPDLFRQLYAAGDRYQDTGGVHSAALTDGETLLEPVEEIGRHNAVDKAIGRALLEGRHLDQYGLVLSARVSAEIALKAARARLRWIGSRSIPTTLAARIAESAGMPIIARAAGRQSAVVGTGSGP